MNGEPLTAAGLAEACGRLDCTPGLLWSVLRVETTGCGFLADRRPKVLFERHLFRAETGGRFSTLHPQISSASPGGYAADGESEWNRLRAARLLDRPAADRATSWGLGQVLGKHAGQLGWVSVTEFVADQAKGEDQQLLTMAKFIRENGLANPLREQRWADFARGYNGPAYAERSYHLRIADAYRELRVIENQPDLGVREAQMLLLYAGYQPGPIDGRVGPRTRRAIAAFWAAQGKPDIAAEVTLGLTTALRAWLATRS